VNGYGFALALVAVVLITIVQLLRTRRLREKYATAWIAVAFVVVVVGVFPDLLSWLAGRVGVQTPVNLLFALGGVVLLVVCIQFSVEITSLEAETRTLAEEIALLRHDLRRVQKDDDGTVAPASGEPSSAEEPGVSGA
jgi:hypothetical protein